MKNNGIVEKVQHIKKLEGYVSLDDACRRSLSRLFNNLRKFSFIIVSSDRGELTDSQNLKRFEKIKSIVNDSGFSYIPVKGKFMEEKSHKVVYENSLIIFPKGRDREFLRGNRVITDDDLFKFGLELIQYDPIQQNKEGEFVGDDPSDVESFGQVSFIFKGENSKVETYDKNGEKDCELGNKFFLNDDLQDYFTQLFKSSGRPNEGKFIFTETYMTAEPLSLEARHSRYLKGELLNYY